MAHFDSMKLDDDRDGYNRWRSTRLAAYESVSSLPVVELSNGGQPTPAERQQLLRTLALFNMVLYASKPQPMDQAKKDLVGLGRCLGLDRLDANLCSDEDAITPLAVSEGSGRRRYIPYTNKPISWHTDGYYNRPDRQIRAMALHCVSPADSGGGNQLIDPTIAYILLRDENPDYIGALMHPRAMTIPANIDQTSEGETTIRPAQTGPVFSADPTDGALHMRYTARTRSIEWRDDPTTNRAVAFLAEILNRPSPYVMDCRMAAGQGVICNNVLHNRSTFEDTDNCRRLVLRARYYDRILTQE